ncbi:MAG: hypothetical protein IJR90_00560 [Clostridia bacterium]|nr:hypothetical protein [Clostridia bacterium]
MGNFLKYLAADLGELGKAFWNIFVGIFNFFKMLFNFPERLNLIREYAPDFSTLEWVFLIITEVVLIAVALVVIWLVFKLLKKLLRFRVSVKKYDELAKQVKNLQRDLLRANYEKDKLLQMKVAELGIPQDQLEDELKDGSENEGEDGEEEGDSFVPNANRNTMQSPCVNPEDSRFFRLTTVDNYYKTEYQPPVYDNEITLSEFCERFRKYAASQLKLYYDIDMMRYYVASMGAARILILQGISGTGKTSLAYAFGRFVGIDTTLCSVQPSWRERTELYGYYNEFTRKYMETDFLRAIYEGNFYRDPHFVILDEMNIARVEYYFAEMLSILEMPRKEEWKIDIVTATWDNDPALINNGTIQISDNIWFVGTINNDDSTFAVADKVYDRAIPIDLDSRADAFTCELTDPVHITTDHLEELFAQAKKDFPVSAEMLDLLEDMNKYLIKNFRLAFGNRIMKQLKDFVPCFIACGGTEIQAIDFIVAKKVLRKFESLSLGFMKDELTKFNAYLDKTFGKNMMPICKEYVDLLKKNN